ncbi:MAG: DNA repair protein RadC [Oscillospiraceae bacterium]|nr:DNA repair protein RadC [Oscillospiraceae bacterium]
MAMHDGHRQRMRQRYLRAGLDGFDDLAILEFLLHFAIPRRDTNPIAHALLDRYGSLSAVLEAPAADLQQVEGVGESAAVLLTLLPAVARRHMIQRAEIGAVLDTTTKCGEYLLPRFFGERDEVVWMLCLDAKLTAVDCRLLARGGFNTVAVSARKVVETALRCNAASVVLAHNHPGGIAVPSAEDTRTTDRLRRALSAVGIELADHIVAAGGDFVSMAASGGWR